MDSLRFRPSVEQLESRDVPAMVSFAVNEAISSVTLSGAFGASGVGDSLISEQGPGSLHTAVDGTIVADVDETNGTIRFLNGTHLILANSGFWEPGIGGVVPSHVVANFGAEASTAVSDALAAVRGAKVTFASGTLPFGGGNLGTFDGTQLTGIVSAGSMDYFATLGAAQILAGSVALTGLSAPNMTGAAGTLNRSGTTLTLTVPVTVTYEVAIDSAGSSATLVINGTLQALATVPPPSPVSAEPAPHALQAISQIVQTLQRGGIKLAGFAFGETSGDGVKDIVLTLRQRNGKLLVATLSGTDGGVLRAFQPFPQPLASGAQLKSVLVALGSNPIPKVGLIVSNGGPKVPRVSVFTIDGERVL